MVGQQCVFFYKAVSLEVHVQFVFGQCGGEQLSVACRYVTPQRMHSETVYLISCGYFFPIIVVGKHGVARTQHYGKPNQKCCDYYECVSFYYFVFIVSFVHRALNSVFLLIFFQYERRLCRYRQFAFLFIQLVLQF